MNNTDLHLHTTASDGGYTPSELVTKCKEVGLDYIAITDHDTISGVQEAMEVGNGIGVTVIPGIEFSTKEQGKSVHMLGFDIDLTYKPFLEMLKEQQEMRKKRLRSMIGKFNEISISLTENDILKHVDGASIGRPHIAKALVEQGVVKTVAEAFDQFLAEGKPCYVKREKELTPEEAMEWIHKAKGVSVVAHPVYYSFDKEIENWVASGLLDGIEVYHRDHDEATRSHYENLVETLEGKYNKKLIVTGGSDFHHEDYGRVREALGVTRISNHYALALLHHIKKSAQI